MTVIAGGKAVPNWLNCKLLPFLLLLFQRRELQETGRESESHIWILTQVRSFFFNKTSLWVQSKSIIPTLTFLMNNPAACPRLNCFLCRAKHSLMTKHAFLHLLQPAPSEYVLPPFAACVNRETRICNCANRADQTSNGFCITARREQSMALGLIGTLVNLLSMHSKLNF